jgi:hypothetical protein
MNNKIDETFKVKPLQPYSGNRIAIITDDTVTIYEYGKEPVTMPRADYKFSSE